MLLWFWLGSDAFGQGSKSDYERAFNLRKNTENKVHNLKLDVSWLTNSSHLWYRRELPSERSEFILVDTATGAKRPAFDHAKLATALTASSGKEARPDNLPISNLRFAEDIKSFTFANEGKSWRCDASTYELRESKDSALKLESDESLRASKRTGAETTIVFANQTMGGVEIFWLDTDGKRQSYGRLGAGERKSQHTFAGHVWLVETREGREMGRFMARELTTVAEIGENSTRRSSRRRPESDAASGNASPDKKWISFIRDHQVVVRERETGKETQLSHDGGLGEAYSEELSWSPDSTKLVGVRVTAVAPHKVTLVESSPSQQVQPLVHTYDYFKPGDKLPHPHPVLFDVTTRKGTPIKEDLFQNPFTESGRMEIRWFTNSSRFTFVYNQRGHQVLRVIAVNADTGEPSAIVDERSETFVDYSGKQFSHWMDASRELIWMSERDGWNHLYLYDSATGRVKNQITKGEWVVRGVDRVDDMTRKIWFRAGGVIPGQDPYHVHFCRVDFDGSDLKVLTEGDGTHALQWSPDNRFMVDSSSRVDNAPVHELRQADSGKLITELERADWSKLLKTGWRAPERFTAKGRDGVTDIYGVIYRPSNFDPAKKYPVIEYIYAGPHDSHVPKGFAPVQGGWAMEMAELGFIVVQIDGMGTSNRSKKFHDVCWQNIGDSGFPDRISWIKAAAATYTCMDLNRVGIYGGSAGGQSSTRALLAHGDFYKVAVSDCGCHDNRMDKIWWNEQWMGWPVGPHYAEQSNVTQAHRLQGKLLLTVGELDRNVDPASTMQVANALVKADKDFDLLIIPGAGHGSAESPYGRRRRADFFVRHLLGVEPRALP
ncbi:MAG: S9 family peptidase [Pedosphaera sp.]|nr:S9 family peptidase [Pedosphaera sp.]